MQIKNIPVDKLISLRIASNLSGLSQGHLNYLVRGKKMWGIKLGRNWFTTKEALNIYLETNRKPGPKKG